MEKQKKIKAFPDDEDGFYWVYGIELRQALTQIVIPEDYEWIVDPVYKKIYMHKDTLKLLNELWKNRKR